LQRGFVLYEPLASGPPKRCGHQSLPKVAKKEEMEKRSARLSENLNSRQALQRRYAVEERKRVYTHQGAAEIG